MRLPNPLRDRIRLATLLPSMAIAVALLLVFGTLQYLSLESALAERGRAEARQLADAADEALRSGNGARMERLVQAMNQIDGDISAVTILDAKQRAIADSGHSVLDRPLAMRDGEQTFVAGGVLIVTLPIRSTPASEDDLGATAGAARTSGTVVLELSRTRLQQELFRFLAVGIAVVMFCLMLAGLAAARIARGVAAPLQQLGEVVRRIAGGDLAARIEPALGGAVTELENGINELAQRMATNRDQQNARIAAATAELRGRKEEAERAASAKSRFLAAAGHDLRQPMHALGLFVSRLGSLDISHEAHGVVRRIEESVAALDSLFDAMLDVSRIDAGLVVPNPRSVDVEELFNRVHKELAASIASQGLAIRHRTAPGLRLHTDPALVERILVNLASNSIRFTRQGGLLLTARPRGGKVRLAVWDTGIGIPAESQQIIFDEYVQLGNPERDRSKGLGLGLSICHRLARLVGTRLYLRSVPGKGSVFWFDLPLESVTQARQSVAMGPTRRAVDEPVTGMLSGTVVVVDDDELVLNSTADLLTSWGCRVVAAQSVADVLGECSRLGASPDAAVVDYRLRGFENGLYSARALRDRFGVIPVMMLTGDMSEQFRLDAGRNGFEVMAKPLKPARLRAMLQHMLGRVKTA